MTSLIFGHLPKAHACLCCGMVELSVGEMVGAQELCVIRSVGEIVCAQRLCVRRSECTVIVLMVMNAVSVVWDNPLCIGAVVDIDIGLRSRRDKCTGL